MLTVLKNDEGYIYAYADWMTTAVNGSQLEGGLYLYVKNIWVHPKKRFQKVLRNLIYLMDNDEHSKSALFVYWKRTKYDGRLSDSFSRLRLKKMGVKP